MKNLIYYSILSFFILTAISCKKESDPEPDDNQNNSTTKQQYAMTAIANYPGLNRSSAVSFVIKGYGYVGLGEDYPDAYKDFYKYDPSANTWTKIADFGGVARREGIAFSLGNFGYAGLGYGETGSSFGSLYDLWKYDPSTDTWSQLKNFPGGGAQSACSFVINSTAYVITGSSNLYEYNSTSDSWTKKAAFPGESREDATVFVIGSKAYYGTGYDDGDSQRLNDLWEYDPATDQWTQKTNFPGTARNGATGFSIGNNGFVGLGNNFSGTFSDFWSYDPSKNTWYELDDSYPAGGGNDQVSFVINNVAYIGTGYLTKSPFGTTGSKSFYSFKSK